MDTNLFGYESYSKPLGDRFLHATVVPCGDEFISTVTVENEDSVVYRHEVKFASRDEARIDLHNTLERIYMRRDAAQAGHYEDVLREFGADTPLGPLGWKKTSGPENYTSWDKFVKPAGGERRFSSVLQFHVAMFSGNHREKIDPGYKSPFPHMETDIEVLLGILVIYHRERSFKSIELALKDAQEFMKRFDSMTVQQFVDMAQPTMGRLSSEETGEFDTHVDESIGDVLPKSHYLSHRTAAALEHYSHRPNLTTVDPKFHGAGISGAESRRKRNDPENWVDRSYFYDAGSTPESDFTNANKYVAELPADVRIYDMGADPDHIAERSINPGGVGVDVTLMEKNVKNAGYFGFRNSRGSMPYAVGVFYPLQVRLIEPNRMGER